MSDPSQAEDNGRDAKGRFGHGNRIGLGNPHAKKIGQIRAALMDAISPEDIRVAVLALVEQAKSGDRFALAEILDRTIGRSIPMDVEERLARLEELAARAPDSASRWNGNGHD